MFSAFSSLYKKVSDTLKAANSGKYHTSFVISSYYGEKYNSRVSTFNMLKVETVSTFNWLKVETVSTFNWLKVESVSTFNWLKVETDSTFKHFLFIYRNFSKTFTSIRSKSIIQRQESISLGSH